MTPDENLPPCPPPRPLPSRRSPPRSRLEPALNRTHAMAALRARGGRLVRAIEARRRGLVAARVLAAYPAARRRRRLRGRLDARRRGRTTWTTSSSSTSIRDRSRRSARASAGHVRVAVADATATRRRSRRCSRPAGRRGRAERPPRAPARPRGAALAGRSLPFVAPGGRLVVYRAGRRAHPRGEARPADGRAPAASCGACRSSPRPGTSTLRSRGGSLAPAGASARLERLTFDPVRARLRGRRPRRRGARRR